MSTPSHLIPKLLIALATIAAQVGCRDSKKIFVCDEGYEVNADSTACVPVPSTCEPDGPGSIMRVCKTKNRGCYALEGTAHCGACLEGYVESAGACLAASTCADLACADLGRACIEGSGHASAVCDDCIDGRLELDGACVELSCQSDGRPGSLLESCRLLNRSCLKSETGAVCGECWAGYRENGEACVAVRTCQQIGCASAHRACEPESLHGDARCSGCLPGYTAHGDECVKATAVCDPPPAEGSISQECSAAHRECLALASGAECGDCTNGFVEDEAGLCVAEKTCPELDCASLHRDCASVPAGHCTDCLSGYVADLVDAHCRPVLTCDDLLCTEGTSCFEATENADAKCQPGCSATSVWNGRRCEPCPPCTHEGELGQAVSPTSAGYCICNTAPGYFYSLGADIGTFACDADGDGWTRESARSAVTSPDPVLRANARCELRSIDGFELVNESGEVLRRPLTSALSLFESDRNDDDRILDAAWAAKGFEQYGKAGRRIRAAELNRLTKICHDPVNDYNDNGVADVAEWGTRQRTPTLLPEQAPFNRFSYFVELYWGEYRPPTSGKGPGTYVIHEKNRSAGPELPVTHRVPMTYAAGDGAYWRQCRVMRDAEWQRQQPPVGMDLAEWYDPEEPAWSGMNHHSQFKCTVIADEPSAQSPQEKETAALVAEGYRLNSCATRLEAETHSGNPSLTPVECELASAASLQPGDVVWAAVPYIDHGRWVGKEYERGCVNECIDALQTCPHYQESPEAIDCLYDAANFGRFLSCAAQDLCDNIDNDDDGAVDEDNPGGGKDCDSGLLGVCARGTTNCRNGAIACDPNTLPGVLAESCNGEDDDCDGTVDEDPVEDGQPCVPESEDVKGECRANATYRCAAGIAECIPAEPSSEICDLKDNDCDGQIDLPAPTPCTGDWEIYFPDFDGDTYGVQDLPGVCFCKKSALPPPQEPLDNRGAYTAVQKPVGDCCDRCTDGTTATAANVRPGATDYQTERNCCGNYDWNCDLDWEKRDKASGRDSCYWSMFACHGGSAGWASGGAAECGATAAYFTGGCFYNWGAAECQPSEEQRTQACR
jgi:hypothetical protein